MHRKKTEYFRENGSSKRMSVQTDFTIIGLEPHPEDKKNGAYDRISLSDL